MKKLLNPFSNSSAFTLVELLVVIAIIGVLSTIGYAVYSNASVGARDAKRKADIDAISKALEEKYDIGAGRYPLLSELGNTDFTSGSVPTDNGTSYYFRSSQSGGADDKKAFVVCASNLEASYQPYCKYSANGNSAAIATLVTPSPRPTPSPSPTPRTFKYAFVTSTTYNGNLGGLSGADTKCQARADAAGLGGTYKAWLSTTAVNANASSRRDTTRDSLRIAKTDTGNTTIATNWTDFTKGSLASNINYNENRTDQSTGLSASNSPYVWTGSTPTGALYNPTCSDWTSDITSVYGYKGDDRYANSGWSTLSTSACNNSNIHLYCIEQ